ncbi:Uncharacterised protein [Moraxella caviae]|nr:surface-adhesin E family protein [Moraxella caviae]STZ14799.1 Uncharacterised protein [Moraxella caviae]
MKIKSLAVLLCGTFLCSNLAQATTWVKLHELSNSDKNIYIEKDNIKKYYFNSGKSNEYYYTTWVMEEYTKEQKSPVTGQPYRYETTNYYFDCENKRYTLDAVYYFNETLDKYVDGGEWEISADSSEDWWEAKEDAPVRLQLLIGCLAGVAKFELD